MLWSIDTCQNKVLADQYHVTISRAQAESSLKLTAHQVPSFSIGSRAPGLGRFVRKRVNANPRLNIYQRMNFSLLLFCVF